MAMRRLLREPVVVYGGTALAAALAAMVVLRIGGYPLRPGWFLAAAVAAAAVSLTTRQLGGAVAETDWPERVEAGLRPLGGERRVQYLATWVREARQNPDTFTDRIQPVLYEAVRARLLRGHGIDLTTDPGAARAVTGDRLWRIVTGREPWQPTYEELTTVIDAVEGL
jgi:hypothetical protein